jgi:folate-binding protein YgfZ
MKADWKSFLAEAGAEFEGELVATYGNPVQELNVTLTGNVFADLSHCGLISVHGPDAHNFLQSQLSNDLRELGEDSSQLNSWCNAKGRMLVIFRVFMRRDSYYLRLPVEMVDEVIGRLQRYVLRQQVSVEDASNTFIGIGLCGPGAVEELRNATGAVPEDPDGVARTRDMTIIRVPGIHPRFEIYTVLDAVRHLWDMLNVRCAPVGLAAWKLLEIEAGLPTVYPATAEAFVPQMANLQLVGGVSFKKGCYPGQEVIARMQYLGKLKRRMYLGHVKTGTLPQPGDDLYGANDAEQPVGKIVDAQPHPDGGYAALAVIQIVSADDGDVHLGSADGPRFEFRDLPYAFAEPAG